MHDMKRTNTGFSKVISKTPVAFRENKVSATSFRVSYSVLQVKSEGSQLYNKLLNMAQHGLPKGN